MHYLPPEIFQKINQLNIETVAQSLGLSVIRHETKCFMHDDKRPSLKFHKNGHIWKCFVCDKGGGPIKLVMHYFKIDYIDASIWLCNKFRINIPNISTPNRVLRPLKIYNNEKPQNSTFNRAIGKWIVSNAKLSSDAKNFLFNQRKLSADIINLLNIKSLSDPHKLINSLSTLYSDDELVKAGYLKINGSNKYLRLFTPCLLFPYYDEHGDIIGLQTRYIGNKKGVPRFQFVAGFKPSIYNKQITNGMNIGENLYLSEGITDCLALLSCGYKAIAIPSASNLPLVEMRDLCKFNLIMSVDRDEAGERAFETLSYQIVKMGGKIQRLDYPIEFKDYGEYYKSSR